MQYGNIDLGQLSECWPRSMSPNGVTRPQWVNNNQIADQVTILCMETAELLGLVHTGNLIS